MSRDIREVPLTEVSLQDASQALNEAYQGYVVPITFDARLLSRRIQAEHVDLDASRLFHAGGPGPAGIMLIARRGRVSRIAALGIVPHLRGAGVGARAVALAVAEARARGDDRMVLEVIETNRAAVSTYVRAGFVPRRRLVGYGHDPVHAGDDVVSCSADEVLPLLLSAYPADASWQTSPLCFTGATLPVEAFRTADGTAAALVDSTGGTARLLAFAVAPSAQRQGRGRRFLQDVMGACPDKPWAITATLPEGQASGFLKSTGWKQSPLAQLEMEISLAA